MQTTDSLGGLEALAALEGTGLPTPPHGRRNSTPFASASPATSALGACGLPYGNDAQRREQDIHAEYGTCARMGGAADASEGTQVAGLAAQDAYRPEASEFADSGAPGACGIPYLDRAGREEQDFWASEGECAEYVEEVEAEGY